MGYAERDALHIEVRYNYEDVKTASVFGGYRFETGQEFKLNVIPMLGIAFGNTDGIIPGLELELTWKKLDFYCESEYVIDFKGSENNYFYTWSELGITPLEHFRTGISISRTGLIQSDLDLQRGIFVQYSFWKLITGFHYFNPFTDHEYAIVTLNFQF